MKTKFFRETNQQQTTLSPKGHLSGRAATLSRVAHLSCLLVLLTATFCATAQNGITLSGLVVDAGTVTFNVSWKNTGMPAIWSDTVWVWVDYNTAGTMTRLPLAPGATLTTTSVSGVGKVMEVSGNNKGVWVVGNARNAGSFSATVKLLTATADVGAACAYASNYPPVGKYTSVTDISITGTRPYDLVLQPASGSSTVTQVADGSYSIPAGYTLQSFTDKTGAPGFIVCMPMSGNINFVVTPNPVQTGRAATFTVNAEPTAPPASAITYNWAAPGFTPDTHTGTTFSATAPAVADMYDVTLTARSTAYCDLTRTNSVTAMDCIASSVYDLKASATAFCTGATVTFALSNTAAGRTYQLYKGSSVVNTLTGTGSAATFTGAFAGAGVYTAQVVAENGYCAAAMTGSHTVSENALPNVPTGASSNARCGSGTVTFSATALNGCTIDWYTTSTGSTIVSGGSSITSFSPTITGSTTYHAQARNMTTGCVSTTRLAVTGTVNAVPAAPSGASSNTRCGSGTVTFSATAPSSCTIDWYMTASNGSIVSGGGSVTSFAPSITSSTTYYAQARNSTTGCVSASRLAVTGTVNAVPTAPTGASSNARCGSGTVTFSATTTTAGSTIDWYTAASNGSIVSGGSSVTSFAPSITGSTTYYAQARNRTTGCVSASRLAVTGTVNTVPDAPTNASANSRCGSGTVTFSATAPSGCTIDWYTAGGSIVSNGRGVTSFSPNIYSSTTYYAQARNSTTNCVSSTRTAVVSICLVQPIMSIRPIRPNQYVIKGTDCGSFTCYSNYNVTNISLSSGALPPGVSASWSGASLTISGKPTAAGTFEYQVTAYNTTACPSQPTSGSFVVGTHIPEPITFNSSNTWTHGNLSMTDFVRGDPSNCTLQSLPSAENLTRGEFYERNGRYFYNRICMVNNLATLCPSPWRIMTLREHNEIVAAGSDTGCYLEPNGNEFNTLLAQTVHWWVYNNQVGQWCGGILNVGVGYLAGGMECAQGSYSCTFGSGYFQLRCTK